MKRLSITLIALVLAGLIYFIARSQGSKRTELAVDSPAAPGALEVHGRPALLLPEDPVPDSIPLAWKLDEAERRDALHDTPHHPDLQADADQDASSILIEIVEARTQAPVPAAKLYWIRRTALSDEDLAAFGAELNSFDSFFEHLGTLLIADEKGQVRFSPPAEEIFLLGKSPGLWAMQALLLDATGFMRMELGPDPSVSARVTDAQGKPVANVPVCLRMLNQGQWTDSFVTRSDQSGIASIEHFQLQLQQNQSAQFFLAIPTPMDAPLEALLDREDWSRQVALVLPAHGGLQVRLLDQRGNLVPGDHVVRTSWEYASPPPGEHLGREAVAHKTLVRGGRAQIFPVSLGLTLELVAHTLQDTRSETKRIGGPVQHGQWIEVQLLAASPTLISGRLLLPDGSPARLAIVNLRSNWELQFNPSFGNPSPYPYSNAKSFRTNDQGFFQHELPDHVAGREIRSVNFQFLVQRSKPQKDEALSTLAAELKLGAISDLEQIALGDIVLGAPPLLLAGVVLDAEAVPIRGAKIALLVDPGQSSISETFSTSDGSFAMHGYAPTSSMEDSLGRLLVIASHANFIEARSMAVPGSQNLRFQLELPGQLKGQLLLEPGQAAGLAGLALIPIGAADTLGRATRFCSVNPSGEFYFESVPGGSFDLYARLAVTGEQIPLEQGIEIGSGRTQSCGAIDLQSRFGVITLNLLGDLGMPQSFKLRLEDAAGLWSHELSGQLKEALLMGTQKPRLDLKLFAEGYREMLLEGVAGERDVLLQRAD